MFFCFNVRRSLALLAMGAAFICRTFGAVHYVDLTSSNPSPPFTSWATAATNIQDAVDVAAAGDTVLVTNGVYSTGGKSLDGVITNRVSVTNAISLQSVNGPEVTIIQGAWDPVSTNGPGAIRCLSITNKASLTGFTIRGGATRPNNSPGDSYFGGGILSSPKGLFPNTNIVRITNCIITGNSSGFIGGGAAGAMLVSCKLTQNICMNSVNNANGAGASGCLMLNCLVSDNRSSAFGGGVGNCYATNCAFLRNTSVSAGSAVNRGTLVNCTVVSNATVPSGLLGGGTIPGGAIVNGTLINSIVYNNKNLINISGGSTNYGSGCTFIYSDSDPLPPGMGNIDIDPQLVDDSLHLASTSPCRGAGTNDVLGADIDGQPWNNPPSMGCDEWNPAPAISVPPLTRVGVPALGMTLSAFVGGQFPFTFAWFKDGSQVQNGDHYSADTADLMVKHLSPEDAGVYQVVVSNSFGSVTSQVAQVVIHAVDQASSSPLPPFSTWSTAATNIQDAIDVSLDNDIVLVTNGVYSSGGKVKAGNLTNRIALDKAVTVTSASGFALTVIEGALTPGTGTGTQAVRCAWVGDGASLIGFTLRNGATRNASNFEDELGNGGGAWCTSAKATIANCFFTNNVAGWGGGCANGTLRNCFITGNRAASGGGTYLANLNNCTVVSNLKTFLASGSGVGTYRGQIRNSIVMYNYGSVVTLDNHSDVTLANYSFCCTDPLTGLFGSNNIRVDPGFLGSFHIFPSSACIAAGSGAYASGTDLDGDPWGNPPPIGCDQVILTNFVGPLSVAILAERTNGYAGHPLFFASTINGLPTQLIWSFDDGIQVTNFFGLDHSWPDPGEHTATLTAYNLDNPGGVSTNLVVHYSPVSSPQIVPSFSSINGFQISFYGELNVSYTTQYATNLLSPINWQLLDYYYAYSEGPHSVSDHSGTNGTRFYRVIAH